MRRREFIAGLGSAAAWPFAARAQRRPAMPVVGYLYRGSPRPNENLVAAFRKGMSETGYVEGRNVAVEYRFAEDHIDRLPELASDLVRQGVAVIATPGGTATVQAAKAVTSSIPIVFEVGTDPVEDGLVASFNRPGGNITGVTAINAELTGKRLGLLRDVAPKAVRIGVLIESNSPFVGGKFIAEINAAGAEIGRQIEILLAGTMREVDGIFASLVQKRIDALLVYASPVFGGFRVEIAALAARHAVPAMYWDRIFTEAGGLISYGTNGDDQFRQVGVYVGRILNGERPANLPVLRPSKFELILNLKTARALGLTIPETILATADEVIQ
jgi:putative tryptophan/tyrosine transport system substrate-binding protein